MCVRVTDAHLFVAVAIEEQLARILIQLLNYRFALTDLVAANALVTLYAMLLSECPPHNFHLRDRMQLVVSATVKYMSDAELVSHLQKRNVVQTFVQQMRASRDSLTADTLVGVLNVLVALLKVRHRFWLGLLARLLLWGI